MQWRRQKRITHVIGSSNHVLLLARYQDAPPGEEDEEEGGLRKDYVKSQDKDTNTHTFDRNGQAGYKPRRTGSTITSSGNTSGYANSVSRSHRDESSGSPSQPKIIFNEDEYTRITTPRQDVLFKKGYLSRKKPWTGGNASTSATPSTAESQSASHSTADGSETTEDQQLLDRDTGTGEYSSIVDPGTQLGYGTYYDHASGYYYEYPVMLVGPAPVPAQVAPSVLAAVPCGPVPLRPIEWINPAFVPKLANQPYCLMDYQTSQNTETVTIVEEQNGTMVTGETSNGVWNENGTGSCSGSVTGETEEQTEEVDNATAEQQTKEQLSEEQHQCLEQHQHFEGRLENGGVTTTIDPYLDPLLMQEPPPMHMSHVVPAAPQSYMYPGHYMFGLPLVDVNGVTIQSGPLVRTMDITAMTMACTKRRKKRKKRKQKRPILGNTEDEEEGEYSSECDNDISSSRLPWSECPTTITTTTTAAAVNRPLNPECQEFQLRPALQSRILSSPVSTSIVAKEITIPSANNVSDVSSCIVKTELVPSRETSEKVSNTVQSQTNQEDTPTISSSEQFVTKQIPSENIYQPTGSAGHTTKNTEVNVRTNCPFENTKTTVTIRRGNGTITATKNDISIDHEETNKLDIAENGNDSTDVDVKCELFQSNGTDIDIELFNNHVEYVEVGLTNGKMNFERLSNTTVQSNVPTSRSRNSQTDIAFSEKSHLTTVASNVILTNTNAEEKEEGEIQRLRNCNTSLARTTSSLAQPRKYKKSAKFVRELTPGPDLDDQGTRSDIENNKVLQRFEAIELSDDTHAVDCECAVPNKLSEINREVPCKENSASEPHDNDDNKTKTNTSQDTIEGSINEDSGFESQTRLFEYPITNAVTEWLRRANSPDLFLTSASISDNETDEEDNVDMDGKPPKNLQGNPMPALSANSSVDNDATTALSRMASCGEFAKTNNNNYYNNIKIIDRVETSGASAVGRRKRDAISMMRRKSATKRIDKRSSRNVDEKAQNRLVSSLVSCHRLENLVTAVRLRNPPKNNVGDVCEFTQEDSVAGMRVALSSRINSNRVNARRTKTSRRINRDLVENVDIRMRRIDDTKNDKDGNEIVDDTIVSVRTFEKGEIIVSEDGKLLPTSSYKPISSDDWNISGMITANHAVDDNENVETHGGERRSSSENSDENMMMSSVSIEEPDVLECWEAETIEPVITPKRMLQSAGIQCEGEAVEEDNFEIEKTTMEHVRKYYRLARDNAIGIEEESNELCAPLLISVSKPRTVPNNSEKINECPYGIEEIPVIVPDKSQDILGDERIPIDEAFEAYESCYTGKSSFLALFDSKMFKQQRPFYGQNGEGPIPCRAVCCNIQ